MGLRGGRRRDMAREVGCNTLGGFIGLMARWWSWKGSSRCLVRRL